MPPITPEQLALMVQKGFADMHERFTHTSEDLTAVKDAIASLKTDMRGVTHALAVVQEDVDALTTLVDTQNGAVSRLNRRVDNVQERMSDIEKVNGIP